MCACVCVYVHIPMCSGGKAILGMGKEGGTSMHLRHTVFQAHNIFICSFYRYFLKSHYVPGTMQGSGDS